MTVHDWLTVVTCTGELALAIAAIAGGTTSALDAPLALLSLDLFAWNFCSFAYDLSHRTPWRWVDLSLTPLTVPLLLSFVLTFVGQRRSRRYLLWAAFGSFGLLSCASLSAFFVPALERFPGSRAWALSFVAVLLPSIGWLVFLVIRHLTSSIGEERARTRLVALAILLGVLIASTELWKDMGLRVPPLGNFGTLVGNALLFVSAGQFKLLGRALSQRVLLFSSLLAAGVVGCYFAIFVLFGPQNALRLLGTLTVAFVLAGFARVTLTRLADERERVERLATIGRFASQLAHDLKNPLAAVKGAAQFLEAEHGQGHSLVPHAQFLRLIVGQTERLERVIENYQRLGRVEPVLAPLDPNELVGQVLALQAFAAAGVKVEHELTEVPSIHADRDLLANALENLLRNAAEAMPAGGTITVRSERRQDRDSEAVELSVADTGQGMDSRTRERAFDEFYTTKRTGSGLGLAFVRRVIEAHGGRIAISSAPGRGTVIRLQIPVPVPTVQDA